VNYRHAFHAGNFADCVKHAVLVWLVRALGRKDAPFFVLDTHAGIGRYDLSASEAQRTGEWRGGIGRLLEGVAPELEDYVGMVRGLGLYPGSPVLVRGMMREGDRMACCELHPEDFVTLRRVFGRDRQVSVHQRDAWEAVGALLPPREKRGLVLIDPPYEAGDEFQRVAEGLVAAHRRFGAGVLAAWYPVKARGQVRGLWDAVKASGVRDVVAVEVLLREALDPGRLNGCGLVVVNPPYRFEEEMPGLLGALVAGLGNGEAGEGWVVERLCDE